MLEWLRALHENFPRVNAVGAGLVAALLAFVVVAVAWSITNPNKKPSQDSDTKNSSDTDIPKEAHAQLEFPPKQKPDVGSIKQPSSSQPRQEQNPSTAVGKPGKPTEKANATASDKEPEAMAQAAPQFTINGNGNQIVTGNGNTVSSDNSSGGNGTQFTPSQKQSLEEIAKELSLLLDDPIRYSERTVKLTEYLLPGEGSVASAYHIVWDKLGGEFGITRLPAAVRPQVEDFTKRVSAYIKTAQEFDRIAKATTDRVLLGINPPNTYDRFHEMCSVRAKIILLGFTDVDVTLGRLYNINAKGEDKQIADVVMQDKLVLQQAELVKKQAALLSASDIRMVYDSIVAVLK